MASKRSQKRKKKKAAAAPVDKKKAKLNQAKKQTEKRRKQREADEKRYERPDFPAIGIRERLLTFGGLGLICVAWYFSSFVLFVRKGTIPMIQLASFYFACILWLYVIRCAVESKRRYGVISLNSMWYYSQTTVYAMQRGVSIFIVFFIATMVFRWMFPSPNLSSRSTVCMDIAGTYYLGYIHATYYGREQIPYRYMETIFLVLTFITPYLVYFLG